MTKKNDIELKKIRDDLIEYFRLNGIDVSLGYYSMLMLVADCLYSAQSIQGAYELIALGFQLLDDMEAPGSNHKKNRDKYFNLAEKENNKGENHDRRKQ